MKLESIEIKLTEDENRFKNDPEQIVLYPINNGHKYIFYKSLDGNSIPSHENESEYEIDSILLKTCHGNVGGNGASLLNSNISSSLSYQKQLLKQLSNVYDIEQYIICPKYYKMVMMNGYMMVSWNELIGDFPTLAQYNSKHSKLETRDKKSIGFLNFDQTGLKNRKEIISEYKKCKGPKANVHENWIDVDQNGVSLTKSLIILRDLMEKYILSLELNN